MKNIPVPTPFIASVLLLLVCSTQLVAQADTASINALLIRSRNMLTMNIDSSLLLARQGIALSEKINYTAGLGKGYNTAGVALMNQGNYAAAFDAYEQAADAYQQIGDSAGVAQVYSMKGVCYGFQNLPAEALQWFLRSLRMREQLQDKPAIADLHLKIALVYDLAGDIPKAIEYTNGSLKQSQALGDKKGMMTCYNNLGIFYGKTKQSLKALDALSNAKALATELQAYKVLGDISLNIGKVYTGEKKYEQAAKLLAEAVNWYEKVKFPLGLARTLSAMGELYVNSNNYNAAFDAARKSNVYAYSIGNTRLIYDNYDIMAEAAKKKGDYRSALQYTDSLLVLKDSIFNADKTASLANTRNSYELEKRETAIRLLEQENIAKTSQRNMLLMIIAFAAILIAVVILLYIQTKKKNRVLDEQKKKLQEMNVVREKFFSILSHDLRTPLAGIISVTDLLAEHELSLEERRDIWRQLRSSAAATLDTMENMLFWAKNQLHSQPALQKQVNLKQLTEEIATLYKATAVNKQVEIVNAVDNRITVMFDKDQLAFIIRNLVANAVKFSHTGDKVIIDAKQAAGSVEVSVADTGLGMDEKTIQQILGGKGAMVQKGTTGEQGSGIGLIMVNDFLQSNNAVLNIHSSKGAGSRFVVRIPA